MQCLRRTADLRWTAFHPHKNRCAGSRVAATLPFLVPAGQLGRVVFPVESGRSASMALRARTAPRSRSHRACRICRLTQGSDYQRPSLWPTLVAVTRGKPQERLVRVPTPGPNGAIDPRHWNVAMKRHFLFQRSDLVIIMSPTELAEPSRRQRAPPKSASQSGRPSRSVGSIRPVPLRSRRSRTGDHGRRRTPSRLTSKTP